MADDDIDTKLDEQFTRFGATLFKYLDKRFAEVDSHIHDLKGRMANIESTVDNIASQLDTEATERAAIIAQLTRHDRWHHQAAKKLGLKLDYEAR